MPEKSTLPPAAPRDDMLVMASGWACRLANEHAATARNADEAAYNATLEAEAIDWLCRTEATGLAGLVAKALAATRRNDPLTDESRADERLMVSILRDLLTLGKETKAASDDPALACARDYFAAWDRVNAKAPTAGTPEHDALVTAWGEVSGRCYRTKPETVAGCLALVEVLISREAGYALNEETRVAVDTLREGLAGLVNA